MKEIKKYICLLLTMLSCFPLMVNGQTMDDHVNKDSISEEMADGKVLLEDSAAVRLTLPALSPMMPSVMRAPGFDGCSSWYMGTYGQGWDLHKGLNAQLGMSVTVGLGKYAPSGVGFGQTAALAYALPLNKRFSLAGGMYVQNMDWGTFHHTDLGLAAVLGFKVNDFIHLYAYGTQSLIPRNNNEPFNPYYVGDFRNRIGAMAEFKLGEHAAISLSVERATMNFPSVPAYPKPLNKIEQGGYESPIRH